MNKSIRKGMQAGLIFGIGILFLALIGFTFTASTLLADALNIEFQAATGSVSGLLIFIGLLGLWAGAVGAPRQRAG